MKVSTPKPYRNLQAQKLSQFALRPQRKETDEPNAPVESLHLSTQIQTDEKLSSRDLQRIERTAKKNPESSSQAAEQLATRSTVEGKTGSKAGKALQRVLDQAPDGEAWKHAWPRVKDDFLKHPDRHKHLVSHLLSNPRVLGDDRAKVLAQIQKWARDGDLDAIQALSEFLPEATGKEAAKSVQVLRDLVQNHHNERVRSEAGVGEGKYRSELRELAESQETQPTAEGIQRLEDHLRNGPEIEKWEHDKIMGGLIAATDSKEHGSLAVKALSNTLELREDSKGLLVHKLSLKYGENPDTLAPLAHHFMSKWVSREIQRLAYPELARRGDKESLELLGAQLTSHEPKSRAEALRLMVRVANGQDGDAARTAVEQMAAVLDSGHLEHKEEARRALLASGDSLQMAEINRLVADLGQLDRSERAGAIKVLVSAASRLSKENPKTDTSQLREKLRGLLGNMDISKSALSGLVALEPHLAKEDFEALSAYPTESTIPILEKAIDDGRVSPQRVAAMLYEGGRRTPEGDALLMKLRDKITPDRYQALPDQVAMAIYSDSERSPKDRARALIPLLRGTKLPASVDLKSLEALAKKSQDPKFTSEVQRHRNLEIRRARKNGLESIQKQIENLGDVRTAEDRKKVHRLYVARKAILNGEIPYGDNPPDPEEDPIGSVMWGMLYEVGNETAVDYVKDFTRHAIGLQSKRASVPGSLKGSVLGYVSEKLLVEPIFGDHELAKRLNKNLWDTMGKVGSRANIMTLVIVGWAEGAYEGAKAIHALHNTVNQVSFTNHLVDGSREEMGKIREFVQDHEQHIERLTGEPVTGNLTEYLRRHRGLLLLEFGFAGHAASDVEFAREGNDYDPIPRLALEELKKLIASDLRG
jgi:hypothetical protein